MTPHPSEFIAEEMIARGWSADDLAMRMSDGSEHDFGICRLALDFYDTCGPGEPKMLIGSITAGKLGKAFDVSPQYFLNLESAWRASLPPPSRPTTNEGERG